MVAPTGEVWGDRALISSWLLRPTWLHLVALTGGVAFVGFKLAATLDGAAVVTISAAGAGLSFAVWASMLSLYQTVAGLTEIDGLDVAETERVNRVVRALIRRLYALAITNLVMAAVIGMPAILDLAKIAIPHVTGPALAAVSGAAFGFGCFSFLVYVSWQEQLRSYRYNVKLDIARSKERKQLLDELEAGQKRAEDPNTWGGFRRTHPNH